MKTVTLKEMFKTLKTTPEKLGVKLGQVRWNGASDQERDAWLAYQTWVVKDNADQGGRLANVAGCPVAWCDRDSQLTGKFPSDWA